MADVTTTNELRTIFTAEMAGLRREMGRLAQSTRGPTNALTQLQGKLASLQSMAIGVAGAYGLGKLAKSLIDVSAKAETSALGMAVMIQSADRLRGKMTPFSDALGEAASTMEKLRKAARDTPGTFDQVRQAYGAILGPGRRAGINEDEMVRIAQNIATQDALGGENGMVIRDVAQALKGRNDADSGVLQMSGIVPKAAALARKGKHGDALRLLSGALEVDPDALKASGESFEGRLATFSDQIDNIKRKAGAPLFKAVNRELAVASEWLEKNEYQIEQIGKEVATGLVSAFHDVKKAVQWLVESGVGEVLLKIYAANKAVGMLTSAFGGLGGILSLLAAHPFFVVLAAAAAGLKYLIDHAPKQATEQEKYAAMMNADKQGQLQGVMALMGGEMQGNPLGFATGLAKVGMYVGNPELAKAAQRIAASDEFNKGQMEKVAAIRKEQQDRAMAAADASDARRNVSATTAKRMNQKLAKAPFSGGVNIDARGSKITVNTQLKTDDPARFADVSLKTAFLAVSAQPLSATFGLGAPRLATGG